MVMLLQTNSAEVPEKTILGNEKLMTKKIATKLWETDRTSLSFQ